MRSLNKVDLIKQREAVFPFLSWISHSNLFNRWTEKKKKFLHLVEYLKPKVRTVQQTRISL